MTKKPKRNPNLNKYIRYSSLAFEMAIMIGLGTYVGQKLDAYFSNSTPGFTIFLSLFCVIGSIYLVIRRLK